MEHTSLIYDIPTVLAALEIDFDVRGEEALALCPMHEKRTGKPDNFPSWWINLDTGQHICFSCHYKGNVVHLVADIKEFYIKSWGDLVELDLEAAKGWLATVAEVPVEILMERLKSLPNYIPSSHKVLEMSEARLAVYVDPPAEALQSRRVSLEAIQKYGILWDEKKSAWIFPLREPHFNKLMGWQEKGTLERTFFNRPAGLQKSKTLFGIENQKEDLVIVVESPLDCARFASIGIQSVVAICGSSISQEQVKLVRYSSTVIAAFDNPKVDKAGKKACDEMRIWARKYGLDLKFFNYGETGKKDPGDLTDEELQWGIDNARHALLGE
jgi:hypothetical protein